MGLLRPAVEAEVELLDTKERIRTLEDALRPFATRGHRWENDTGGCMTCGHRWPCKYETARRALEGEG